MPSPSGCGSTPPWQPSDVPASPPGTSPRTSSDTLSQCACKLRESADQPSLCCLVTNPRLRRAPTSTPTSSSGNGHSMRHPVSASASNGNICLNRAWKYYPIRHQSARNDESVILEQGWQINV